MKKIKVLLTYIVYPMAIATYFKKAFQNREDVDLKVAGIYTGSWIPWNYGMNLPAKYAVPPDLPLPLTLETKEYPYEIVKVMLRDWVPDLIVQIDAGFHAKHKPTDGMVVTVGTDPHVLNDFYDVPRKYSDRFFNMQASYSKPNDIYLPYAYSKYDFYPETYKVTHMTAALPDKDLQIGSDLPKEYDAALIGLQYTHASSPRVQWIEELRKRGLKVFAENGPIMDEARAIYNRAKIGLNWSTLDDLNCRAFELPAMKLAPVMNLVSDIHKFFVQGEHYLGFTSLNEAVENVVWLRDHPREAEQMAERAYQNVRPHTFDARVQQILTDCGFTV